MDFSLSFSAELRTRLSNFLGESDSSQKIIFREKQIAISRFP